MEGLVIDIKTTTIKEQYDLYLKLMQLDVGKMSEVQKIETQRAFYGGFGHLLKLLEGIANTEMPEEEAGKVLQRLVQEMTLYVNGEMLGEEEVIGATEMDDAYMQAFMTWVRNVKRITAIDMDELADLQPEYDEYVKRTVS